MIVDMTVTGFRYVHYGTTIAARLGDQTGRPVCKTEIDVQAKLGWLEMLRRVAARRTTEAVQCDLEGGSGAYLVAMPLLDATSRCTTILAAQFLFGPPIGRVIIRGWTPFNLDRLLEAYGREEGTAERELAAMALAAE